MGTKRRVGRGKFIATVSRRILFRPLPSPPSAPDAARSSELEAGSAPEIWFATHSPLVRWAVNKYISIFVVSRSSKRRGDRLKWLSLGSFPSASHPKFSLYRDYQCLNSLLWTGSISPTCKASYDCCLSSSVKGGNLVKGLIKQLGGNPSHSLNSSPFVCVFGVHYSS